MSPVRYVRRQLLTRSERQLMALLVGYITFVFGALIFSGFYFYDEAQQQRGRIESTADQSHRALCSLRQDLHSRVQSTKDFLENHPQGIPGISRADLVASIANQQRSIDALRFLNCVETP